MRMHSHTDMQRISGDTAQPQCVTRSTVQYLTLASGNRLPVDQEDLEWPMLLVAQELQQLLKKRGTEWEVPLFERIVSPQEPLKLLLELPFAVTWNDYDTIIKKALERRRDFWVVQIRFERITEGHCLQLVHRGSHEGIPAALKKLRAHAAENGFSLSDAHHEIYLNDAEETPERDLQTVLLIPFAKT